MKFFRREPVRVCARRGHDYGVFMRSPPVCVRCGYVDPPPRCWHCGRGHFTDIEPLMGTPCCDYCGLPGYDNAGTIPGTERKAGLGEDEARERYA